MQGFFSCPKGMNIALVCTGKQVKIWACIFWFGSLSGRWVAVSRKNKFIFLALALFAVGVFTWILNDPTFCHRAASQIMAQPFGRLLENQLGQFAGLVFGLIFLKSANFSVYTFGLYLSLIYGS